ncbi:hypothetical protein [Microbacterium terrisoli]|uniref:hypothetical protein n=1 Tax=Microbacterium terrisoli TaxID=3242192 RepID=UPI002806317B|nr:hypothetical protein [Microbacterium protaetiae]
MTDVLRPILDQIGKLRAGFDRTPTIKLATVTQASPLRIRMDGDTDPLPFAPIGVSTWTVGDRVICAEQHRRVFILAPAS